MYWNVAPDALPRLVRVLDRWCNNCSVLGEAPPAPHLVWRVTYMYTCTYVHNIYV